MPLPQPPAALLLVDAPLAAGARARTGPGQPAYDALLAAAHLALATPLQSVTHKARPAPSGDPHDYTSLGTYWWPDPAKPDGLPYIRRDGERNPECDQYDSPRLKRLVNACLPLAWGFFFSGEQRFADHAVNLLDGWFLDPATRMNPHLEFGQFIPGVCLGRGIGIIDTATTLPYLLDATLILSAGGALPDGKLDGLRDWMAAYRDWLVNSTHGREEAAWFNNHGTWYDVQLAAIELYLGRLEQAAEILLAARERRIASQVEPDGSQPHELARTRSLSYSVMNLTGFANLATLGERAGVDLWNWASPDGRSIRAALDWLRPYAAGELPWTSPQITALDPAELISLYRRAALAYHEPGFEAVLQAVPAPDREKHLAQMLYPHST